MRLADRVADIHLAGLHADVAVSEVK